MTKKTVREKMETVAFWTFSGIFWYLVVSFFLRSDYPIQDQPFNHKIAYETIKDALSLAAAFLAPISAFVLFIDWRDMHREKTNEELSEKCINLIDESQFLTSCFNFFECEEQQFLQVQSRLLSNISELQNLSKKIYGLDANSNNFKISINKITLLLNKKWVNWIQAINLNIQKTKNLKQDYLIEYICTNNSERAQIDEQIGTEKRKLNILKI